MATLLIKSVPEELHRKLKQRAARNHRSVMQEAIAILEAALCTGVRTPLLDIDRRRIRGRKPLSDSIIRAARIAGRA